MTRTRAPARQPGAVGEPAQDGELRGAGPGPDADRELRPGGDLRGQEPGAEVPVGEQDHPGAQAGRQQRGAGGLAVGHGAEHGVDDGAGAAADQGQEPQRREGIGEIQQMLIGRTVTGLDVR
jgi:hypothetical protein